MPMTFSPASDIETGADVWAFNDTENRKIHVMEAYMIQPFIDKMFGIVHRQSIKKEI